MAPEPRGNSRSSGNWRLCPVSRACHARPGERWLGTGRAVRCDRSLFIRGRQGVARGVHPLMADAPQIPDEAEVRARWGGFAFTEANMARAKELISHYPEGRQQSAVMGLLDLAQ